MHQSLLVRHLFNCSRTLGSKLSYSTEAEQIIIPKRIERGPTDILRVLAKTHQRDPTAPHYKYHDDPYLIPYSNSSKRSYALSQEAGRKAARWVRQQHAELFNHSVADPPIQVFFPSPVIDENSEITEDSLKYAIDNLNVSDAITAYQSLKEKNVDINLETIQNLLELLCYYNEEDGIVEEWIEEKWFHAESKFRDTVKKTWKDNGLAEELFLSMKTPTPEAYCAIISGMSRHGQMKSAMHYLEEATKQDIQLSVSTFNCLLPKVMFLRESHDLMWKLILELLTSMNERGLKPNLGTLNAVLEALSYMASNKLSKRYALQILSEMKQFGIEPSLASYYYLLNIFYFDRSDNSGILYDIIDQIEGKSLTVRDIKDNHFFVRAMEICRHKLKDINLCYKIDELLHLEDNYNLIGDALKESHYYRYFFFLLCENESLDDVMKVYDKLIPHIYVPETSVMKVFLTSVELNMGFKYLPKLWTDMVQFDLTNRQDLLIHMLDLLNQNSEEDLKTNVVEIGWNIWEKIEGQTRERNRITWTGSMLSDLLTLFLKHNEKSKANLVFDKIDRLQNNLEGEPKIASLKLFIESCVSLNTPDIGIRCIRYCKDMGFPETEEFASLLQSSLSLNTQQIERLNSLLEVDTLNI